MSALLVTSVLAWQVYVVYFVLGVDVAYVALGVFQAGCGALNTQSFFPSRGAHLVAVGGLSTPHLVVGEAKSAGIATLRPLCN